MKYSIEFPAMRKRSNFKSFKKLVQFAQESAVDHQ